jgi:short-subunit dehydrogenase
MNNKGSEKYLLIIGGNSDIAKSCAIEFAKNSFNLILTTTDKNKLEEFSKHVSNLFNVNVIIEELDVLNFSYHLEFWNKVKNYNIEVVLVAVGYLGDQKLAEQNFEEALKIININYTALVSLINIISNDLEKKQKGTIIGISSVAGERGRKSNYIYGSSKAAFSCYLDGLRHRLYSSNVHVITVKPGLVYTKMTSHLKLPKLLTATPEKIAKDIYKAYIKKIDTLYTPYFWKIIMNIIKLIPEKFFKKTNL